MRITVYEQNLCFRTSGYYAKSMENEQNPSLTFSGNYGIHFHSPRSRKNPQQICTWHDRRANRTYSGRCLHRRTALFYGEGFHRERSRNAAAVCQCCPVCFPCTLRKRRTARTEVDIYDTAAQDISTAAGLQNAELLQ